MSPRGWAVLHWALLVAFVLSAALNMLHVRGGFLTSHLADLVVPAWMYVVARGHHAPRGRRTLLRRTLGRSPEIAALALFVASALTEVSQYYWPRGIFRGRFDALDIVAFAAGLTVCYVVDRRSPSTAGEPPTRLRDAAA